MSLAEFLNDPQPTTTAKQKAGVGSPQAKLRKQVFLEFAAIVCVGLLLSAWYVAFRIGAGERSLQASAPVTSIPIPAPVRATPAIQAPATPAPAIPVPAPVRATPAAQAPAKPAPAIPIPAPVRATPAAQAPATPAPATRVPATPAPTAPARAPVPAPLAEVRASGPELESKAVGKPVADARGSVPGRDGKGAEKPLADAHRAPRNQDRQRVEKPPPLADARAAVPGRDGSFKRRDANPRAGEKYLQIAAYGPRALDAYLKTLERQGLHPVVAPGPTDNVYRILIGPFSNSAAIEETRHFMQASGIQPILRSY
jgi:hypothetical protein